jgi:hypothetical protein
MTARYTDALGTHWVTDWVWKARMRPTIDKTHLRRTTYWVPTNLRTFQELNRRYWGP